MNADNTPLRREPPPYGGTALPLPPSAVTLTRREDGQYAAQWEDGFHAVVQATRCFPWSQPDRHISLRDAQDREICYVEDLSELDPASRTVLRQALDQASFVIEITAIRGLREEYEIRGWSVDTVQGPRRFQTKRDEWPQAMPHGGLLIRDITGDLFYIRELARLDADSRKKLSWYVD